MSSHDVKDHEGYVKLGDWVVLHASDGRKVLGNVTRQATARIGKRKRSISSLIGHRWGQNFLVRSDDTLIPVADTPVTDAPDHSNMASDKNNRFLLDSNDNQTLGQETINRLKESGMQGEQLVQTVVQHSSTFKEKTAFSQDKYLARKRAKFDLRVRLIKPTSASLCDVYFVKSPEKTLHIRCDSLALLLAYSGVRTGARILVYENCTGLITGAVAERLAGHGIILNVFVGTTPPGTEFYRMLNLNSAAMQSIVHTPISLLNLVDVDEPADTEPIKYSTSNADVTNVDSADSVSRSGSNANKISTDTSNISNMDGFKPNVARAEAIALRLKRGVVKQWLKLGCDCLVVATRFDVVKVFDTLLKYVAPSGTFAAYCMHLQDAADLQYALQLSRMAIRVELWESTLVQHQVLPGRTHPEMSDSATGGYVVTGVRIETAPNVGD